MRITVAPAAGGGEGLDELRQVFKELSGISTRLAVLEALQAAGPGVITEYEATPPLGVTGSITLFIDGTVVCLVENASGD